MNNELAIIEDITPDRAPAIYGHGSLGQFYDHVKAEVSGEVPDLTTKKGRDRIASLAAKVSKSKVAVEKPGRDYLKRIKELPKTIEAELREFTRQMDDLRDETRKPLTEWEDAEKARVATLEARIAALQLPTENEYGITFASSQLINTLQAIESTAIDDSWQEFASKAAIAKDAAISRFKAAIARQQKHEADQAELERLRLEAEEKARIEREEQIRKEAIEAERIAAEKRAEAERQRVEQERITAQQEFERKEREHQAAIDRANRERAEAEAKAVREKLEAEDRQRKAVEAERQRIESEKLAAQKEAERIASNKAHRAKINRESLADLVRFGMSEEEGKRLIGAIVKGEIVNISIKY